VTELDGDYAWSSTLELPSLLGARPRRIVPAGKKLTVSSACADQQHHSQHHHRYHLNHCLSSSAGDRQLRPCSCSASRAPRRAFTRQVVSVYSVLHHTDSRAGFIITLALNTCPRDGSLAMTLPLLILWTAPCGNGWPPTASGAPGPQNLTVTRSKSAASAWVVPRWGGLCGT